MNTWIVVANLTDAKIYALGKTKGELTLIQEIPHPEGRSKAGDVGYDKPGQFENPMHGQSETFERADPKTVETAHFAKQITASLEAGRNEHAFERLIIVAEPHFYGVLHSACNPHLQQMVHNHIKKDYYHLRPEQLYTMVIELPE